MRLEPYPIDDPTKVRPISGSFPDVQPIDCSDTDDVVRRIQASIDDLGLTIKPCRLGCALGDNGLEIVRAPVRPTYPFLRLARAE